MVDEDKLSREGVLRRIGTGSLEGRGMPDGLDPDVDGSIVARFE